MICLWLSGKKLGASIYERLGTADALALRCRATFPLLKELTTMKKQIDTGVKIVSITVTVRMAIHPSSVISQMLGCW